MPKSSLRKDHKVRTSKRFATRKLDASAQKKQLTKKFDDFMKNYNPDTREGDEQFLESKREAVEVTEKVKALAETIGWDEAEKQVSEQEGEEKMDRIRSFILREKLRDVN